MKFHISKEWIERMANLEAEPAKDANPPLPAVIGKDGQPLQDHEVDAFLASQPPSDPERVARIRRKLEEKLKEARAITVPEASPAKPCGMCGGTGLAKPITQAERDEADRVTEHIRDTLDRISEGSPAKETR